MIILKLISKSTLDWFNDGHFSNYFDDLIPKRLYDYEWMQFDKLLLNWSKWVLRLENTF